MEPSNESTIKIIDHPLGPVKDLWKFESSITKIQTVSYFDVHSQK